MQHQVSVSFEGIDTDTPRNVKLTAKYTKSFAYYAVKDRLPVILTKEINELATNKGVIISEKGKAAEEDLKAVIGKISKLKNEVVTNKTFTKIMSSDEDAEDWNLFLKCETEISNEIPCWYYSSWLYAECYMYRRLWEIFENSDTLQDYDPFFNSKKSAFEVSVADVKMLGKVTIKIVSDIESLGVNLKKTFFEYIKLSLWSNRCDLSLSNGEQLSEDNFNVDNINRLDSLILCNDSEKVFDLLYSCKNAVIDFVNDNASYEVFSDFCFCDLLCSSSLASKIKFHVKKFPWYVSDVMKKDINWLLNELEKIGLEDLSVRWKKYFQNGIWSIHEDRYWTLPFDYSDMKQRDLVLYNSLKSSHLIIFKGDLNYRKLLGDINWDHFEKFENALRNFKPTNVLSLRTIKSDLVCGLTSEKYVNFKESDKMWMRTGEYGLIQLYCHSKS